MCTFKGKSRVLAVDDNPDNSFLIKNLISSEELEVVIADNGLDALQIAEHEDIDIILLDIMLPHMDGYEICEILKSNPKTAQIPIIFLSAKFLNEDILKGFQVGAVDYVTKPFDKDELLSRIKTHLELKLSRDHIQEQKNLLEKQNKQLEELNATKDKFFSIVAHDLKNPFNTILGFSRLLDKRYNTMQEDKRKEFIKIIFESSEHAYNLLENLLEWSRTQTGRISFSPKMVNINEIVRTLVLLTQPSASRKQISLINNIKTDTIVYADEDMVSFILRNILSNAIKFTPTGGKVTILAEIDEHVKIKIKDTGVGISKDVISKLFKIDENISTKGTNSEPGTGLGLILCKEFIEQNNGNIYIQSQPNLGSTFTITIPTKEEEKDNI